MTKDSHLCGFLSCEYLMLHLVVRFYCSEPEFTWIPHLLSLIPCNTSSLLKWAISCFAAAAASWNENKNNGQSVCGVTHKHRVTLKKKTNKKCLIKHIQTTKTTKRNERRKKQHIQHINSQMNKEHNMLKTQYYSPMGCLVFYR